MGIVRIYSRYYLCTRNREKHGYDNRNNNLITGKHPFRQIPGKIRKNVFYVVDHDTCIYSIDHFIAHLAQYSNSIYSTFHWISHCRTVDWNKTHSFKVKENRITNNTITIFALILPIHGLYWRDLSVYLKLYDKEEHQAKIQRV